MGEADSTLREAVEAERARAREERDELLQRYRMAQELEKRHLSDELHDSVGQYITSIRQYAALILRQAATLPDDTQGKDAIEGFAAKISHHAEALTNATRMVLHEQWPEALERDGLHAAIQQQLDFWRESFGDLRINAQLHPLPPFDNAIQVYRIAQEWLTTCIGMRRPARSNSR